MGEFTKEQMYKMRGMSNSIRSTIDLRSEETKVDKLGRKRHLKKYRYEYDRYAMLCYCGEGFYVANKELCKSVQTTYSYDVHWAYGSALIDYDFPLSSEIVIDTPTKCGIILVKFSWIKPHYKQFDYTIFHNNFYNKEKDTFHYIWLTNLDYEIFMDMYDSDAIIVEKKYWRDVGSLPDKLKKLVKRDYIEKKKPENEENKRVFEACYYGLFARDIIKAAKKYHDTGMLSILDITIPEVEAAAHQTGLQEHPGDDTHALRTRYCVIATWQASYLRYREWQHFKENIDNVIYMATDSIYSTKPLDLGEDLGLGYYGSEYNGMNILYLRRNAYIIFNEDGSIYKSKIGGCLDNHFTQDDIDTLKSGMYIYANSYNENHELIKIKLDPSYINGGIWKK